MGLLDGGLQTIFGNVFGPLLLDATLHKASQFFDDGGSVLESFNNYPCKAMEETVSAVVRAQAGIPAKDVRFIVLQLSVGAKLEPGDELTIRGARWKLRAPVDQDPAQASWGVWASPL